jgi:hypothetical protein
MGGSGSGNRSRHGARNVTTDHYALDIRRCARAGALRPGHASQWQWRRNETAVAAIDIRAEHDRVILSYRIRREGEDWQDERYPVLILRTPCHLGGMRPWFLCPARGCGRRVAILYLDRIFACRHCHQLAYASTREEAHDRAARRADRLRARLGWDLGLLNDPGRKPKWMRWRTFARVVAQHDALAYRAMAGILDQLSIIDVQLQRIKRRLR